ncbi:hypothetical protein EW146_g1275 [Bondarzewia mesenterica]|uniref:Alginate lyase domain-containing protein n=1 Tax=Bondarzewia mesenterica TaxID=1095465 RepID=A0A4S4M4G1_9AGAM|nr:hypothetical protein EW146_g1275 [Bondarzewia mesenterica]
MIGCASTEYVLSQGKHGVASTASARQKIISDAGSAAKGGSWTVGPTATSATWGKKSHLRMARMKLDVNRILLIPDGSFDPSEPDQYDDGGAWEGSSDDGSISGDAVFGIEVLSAVVFRNRDDTASGSLEVLLRPTSSPSPGTDAADLPPVFSSVSDVVPVIGGAPNAGAQAPAKPTNGKCMPSPTASMVLGARLLSAWTRRGQHVYRDGKVKPDVRTRRTSFEQGDPVRSLQRCRVLHFQARILAPIHAQSAASALDVFCIASATPMHPNIDCVLTRAEGKRGHITGVLNLRGLLSEGRQFCHACRGARERTPEKHTGMRSWMTSYVKWLEESPQEKKAASNMNNHGSFFVNQLAAVKMLLGDNKGASDILEHYFSH